jgi:hypothetical protein
MAIYVGQRHSGIEILRSAGLFRISHTVAKHTLSRERMGRIVADYLTRFMWVKSYRDHIQDEIIGGPGGCC